METPERWAWIARSEACSRTICPNRLKKCILECMDEVFSGQNRRFDSTRARTCRVLVPTSNLRAQKREKRKRKRKDITLEPHISKQNKIGTRKKSRKKKIRMLKKLLEEVLLSSDGDFEESIGEDEETKQDESSFDKENIVDSYHG